MDIAIDFDGTVVTHDFPMVGKDVGAVNVLKRLVACGHRLILNTMRHGAYLSDAESWFRRNGIPLHGVNAHPSQKDWTESPKVYAQLYIDDAALGVPLEHTGHDRPFVDWPAVEYMLMEMGLFVFPMEAGLE